MRCLADAWRGSWSLASALAAVLGAVLFAALAYAFGLTGPAPTSVPGVVLFGAIVAAFSIVAAWVLIFLLRLLGAPARIDLATRAALNTANMKVADLEESLKPNFALSFSRNNLGLVRTPVIIQPTLSGLPPDEGIYIRIRAEATSRKAVVGCRAYLTRLEQEAADGRSTNMIPLPQPVELRGGQPFDLHPGVPCMIDFLTTNSATNQLLVPGASWPLSLTHVFDHTGTYHFTVTVTGEGLSKAITVEVAWPGQWDKIVYAALVEQPG